MTDHDGPLPLAIRSLSHLDLPAWHDLDDYNDDVRIRLSACQDARRWASKPLEMYAEIYRQLGPVSHAAMCDPQRVRVSWLLAMAYAAVEDHLQALNELDRALLVATELDDQDALVDLLDLRGSLNVYVQHFQEAEVDFGDAAALRNQLPAGQLDERATEEARLLRQRADSLYLLAKPQEAASALARARELLHHAPNDRGLAIAIAIEYTQAHLDRNFGNPEDALLPALHAASYFTTQGPAHANTAARTHLFSAEVALDLVERMPTDDDRTAFLHMARAHLAEGLRLAQEVEKTQHDGALGMVRLSEQRLARLATGAITGAAAREQVIKQVLREAEERDDLMLLAQAHTALADDLAAQAWMSEAIAHYERAIQVVARTEAPVLAIPARRALHKYQEAHPSPVPFDPLEEGDTPTT